MAQDNDFPASVFIGGRCLTTVFLCRLRLLFAADVSDKCCGFSTGIPKGNDVKCLLFLINVVHQLEVFVYYKRTIGTLTIFKQRFYRSEVGVRGK